MPVAIKTTSITAGFIVASILWIWATFLFQARAEVVTQIKTASALWDQVYSVQTP